MIDAALLARLALAGCAIGAVLVAFRYVALAMQRGVRGLPGRAIGGSGGGRRLAVLETAYLPGGASLHVVRAGDRNLVLGRAAGTIALVCELDRTAEPPSRRAARGTSRRAANASP